VTLGQVGLEILEDADLEVHPFDIAKLLKNRRNEDIFCPIGYPWQTKQVKLFVFVANHFRISCSIF
jgi:hypothetical protein